MLQRPQHSDFIPALTGLRGLAALAVFIVHLQLPYNFTERYPLLSRYKELGWTGVSLFFVLSGYLITRLALHEMERSGRFNLGRFYVRRIVRIWPLYFTAVLLGLGAWYQPAPVYTGMSTDPSWGWALITFTLNIVVCVRGHWDGTGALLPLWTIAVEEQFYLIWGLCLRYVPIRRLLGLALAIITLSWGFRLFLLSNNFLMYRMHSAVAIGSLMTGCTLSLRERWFSTFFLHIRYVWVWLLSMLMAVGFFEWPFPDRSLPSFALLTIVDVISAGVVLAAVCKPIRLLTCRIVVRMGEMSYAMYVIHFGLLFCFYMVRPQMFGFLPDPKLSPVTSVLVDAIVTFNAVFLLSIIWSYVESPLQQWRKRLHG